MKAGVILPAGGSGTRMGMDLPKQFQEVGGKPLFLYSLEVFHNLEEVGEIVLVLPNSFIEKYTWVSRDFKKVKITSGGGERWQSVEKGFNLLSHSEVVVVHDVARPFVEAEVIQKGIEKTKKGISHIVAVPATNTIKRREGEKVIETLNRNQLIEVQTPQFFPLSVLKSVYQKIQESKIPQENLTDEAGMVESLNLPVHWILGKSKYRKITQLEDMEWAEWMVERLEKEKSEGLA